MKRGLTQQNIGREDLKRERDSCKITTGPGGVVGDYVPFFFCPRPVMLLLLATGRVEGYSEGEEPIVHLLSDIGSVQRSEQMFVFTDGHAVKKMSGQYTELSDLKNLDWKILAADIWKDTQEDNDRMRRKQAEFLIYESLLWECIHTIGVRSDAMAERVAEALADSAHQPEIVVKPKWYYDK